ncbi:MAG: 16S rRNA (guanine(966)-N(2))-methyltransferase RsmD [Pseudomonadales bacterium]|jgi:16S rRNA (guanine966-N2)-methyltransferase|nr:16S rRNA (guanine(966)-N(2))-methyltransferase RsmD [Pseudomonadales bacterium]MCP5337312.1 16S rRNA (guanine(966)-N(2))-methyltransferase RsmD [Pseudomonadales bacterium]
MPRRPSRAPALSELRIIGGRWRGRRIAFHAIEGVRPTPDRVRETLFNWLQPVLPGSRCLDLFCGSGALAIEALSRGAASVTLLDTSAAVLRDVAQNLRRLDATGAELVRADALEWLRVGKGTGWNIVFLDPPFGRAIIAACLPLLAAPGVLAPAARVYVESAIDEPAPELPTGWMLHREKTAGQVSYRLLMAP